MAEKNTLHKREDIPEKYRWKLEDIYSSIDLWEKDFKKVKDMLPSMEKFKGRLGESYKNLLECLMLRDEIARVADKLYVYSHMRRDEDNGNSTYQALADRTEGLNIEVDREFSFIIPEILQIPTDKLNGFLEKEEIKVYKHYIDEITRLKEHVLSPEMEKLLSMTGDIAQTAENAYRMLSSADIKFPKVKNDTGEEVELSEGRYYQLIRSENREVRKQAFENLYNTYKKYSNTFAATLNGSVKRDIFYARARKYNSSLEAALYEDNIPVSVYENIIETVNNNLKPLHRYMDLRKKMLGLDEVHMYDLYAPLIKDVDMDIPYEEGLKIVEKGLAPLGEKYIELLRKGFNSRWIDVYENQGKTNGAYSWGTYDTNPYILLNYGNKLSDVSTIAHEMGHSIHSYLSRKEQPYIYSEYTLFSAEVASTTNEALLVNYLLKSTDDKRRRIYIMSQHLEEIRTTVYRQTMFAEFEKKIHEMVENGEALTSEILCSMWHDLNVKYYGPNVIVDEGIDIEWARISHFYWNFYVYKYVTGYAAATSLSRKILDEGESAVNRYLKFLKSGDSDYSINLLKEAGVDMTSPEPLENTIKVFEDLLNQIESELR